MFRAVVQDDPTGRQRGTGPAAAVPGYQVSGEDRHGPAGRSALQLLPDSRYNITFAGIAPADDPRYVIGLIMDNPRAQFRRQWRAVGGTAVRHDRRMVVATPGSRIRRRPRLTLEAG